MNQLTKTTKTIKDEAEDIEESLSQITEKTSKSISSSKEKLNDLAKTFTDNMHYKISSQKGSELYEQAAQKLLEEWNLVRDGLSNTYEKFSDNFQKLLYKLAHHSSKSEVTTGPILKCAGKTYTIPAFLAQIEGSKVHELDVDFDHVEDWATLANKLKIPPCNNELKWENFERDITKQDL